MSPVCSIMNTFILTCDALSDKPFVQEGLDELSDLWSVSAWLTSGTNSFCKNDDRQPKVSQSEKY